MAPKGKGKKSKKADDDDYWDTVGETIPPVAETAPEADAAGPSGPIAVTADDDDEFAGGGLMGAINKSKKNKKNKSAPVSLPPTPPVASAADDEDESPLAAAAPALAAKSSPAPAADDSEEEGEEGGVKILSKKQKEKLKKEKEKAKKKAQAEKKKAAAPAAEPVAQAAAPTPVAAPVAGGDDDDEAEDAGAGGAKSKNKKKKKKAAAAEEAPAAPSKPLTGRMAALRAAMEARKAAEEEAAREAEEHRLRIEREEREAEEEEARIAEEKARKKEKERAKKELAKKEGRLLTPKQKAEKAAAEARLAALLASGVQIEGLQSGGNAAAKPKKVVYGNKKKGPPAKKVAEAPAPPKAEVAAVTEKLAKADLKDDKAESDDDWDKSEEDVPAPAPAAAAEQEDDDDWDKSSASEKEEEAEAKPAPVSNGSKAAPAPAAAAGKQVAPPANKKAAAPVDESSSEEDSDSDDSEDDSDDDSDDSDSDDSDDSSSEDELTPAQKRAAATAAEAKRVADKAKAESKARRQARHQEAIANRDANDLRSPICCILGHVDTGKTKLLDKIRQTNVQEGEAGGITQQIGATYFPVDAIRQKTEVLNRDGKFDYKIPGLLVIDTPGHESFTNLRTRGSSLCNIAILVVDIMHGLEPQTLESLKLLRDKKTPFVVALNKIDRIYGWKATPNGAFQESLAKQTKQVQREFADRTQQTMLAFAEQGLNACLYYDNKNLGRNVSLIPTSAITGEGIPDMIMLLVNLTQSRMAESLMYISELECTVLEVKVIEGLGTTIDVVLSNGYLREGDRIVVCGLNGPIYTNVRALLTPQPLREMRVKSAYVHHKEVKAALGIKITAPDLEKAIAGSRLLVVGPDDDEEDLGEEVMADLQNLMSWVDKSGRGVSVQASTLGSLEALLEFLRVSKIPVSTINIGPVHKRDVIQASTMVEKVKEYACMLCFDVPVEKEAEKLAQELGVTIFKAEIIYHLFDAFTKYNKEVQDAKRAAAAPKAIWPCRLKTLQVFARRDPIVLGVDILDGTLRVGTPLAAVHIDTDKATGETSKTIVNIGVITSIEKNHESYDKLTRKNIGAGAAIKIESIINQSHMQVGRHFQETDELYSVITRQSIDTLKEHFRAEAEPSDWALIKKLKPLFAIE